MPTPGSYERSAGFSLIEVLIAVALLALLASGLALLPVVSTRALSRTRLETSAVLAAQTRLEQLSSLAWGLGSAHAPARFTDLTTDLSSPEPSAGGSGLGESPSGTLEADTAGFADYLDSAGRWVARGTVPPGAARFVRRWSVRHVATLPDTIVIQVRVIDRRAEVRDVLFATLRTRTAG